MKILFHPSVLEHNTGSHPESRARIEAFDGLVPEADILNGEPFLTLVHPQSHVDRIREACTMGEAIDNDTQTSPGSFEAACIAVGLTLTAMEQGDFALVRPPGHHAGRETAQGFCLFNNIAIAAQKAANEGKKVLILDFDGHLGDGTMEIFYNNPQVLYWSLHQYPAYPGNGAPGEIGETEGTGFTINTALPPGSGDDIFMHAVNYMLPIAQQFQPDVVAVSAGFDAHQFDPLLELRATNQFYYKIGGFLSTHFPGKIFATLEGGYNTEELPKCVANFIAGINGTAAPYYEAGTTSGLRVWETYEMYLHLSAGKLSKYWKF